MNKTAALLILSMVSAAIAGCNETAEQQREREMTEALQQGAHDPVDWSARNNPPMGKMDRKTGLTSNFKKKD